jgi:hypothetical protein
MKLMRFFERGLSMSLGPLLLPLSLVSLALLIPATAYGSGWPELPMPPGAQSVDIGQAMRINGLPVQVRGFLSAEPVSQIATWFHMRLGNPLVTSRHDSKTLLGQARDGYYLTVQLETAGSGTRGLIAQTDVRGMMAGRNAGSAADASWQARLPAGTRLLSLVEARDGARRSQQVVLQSRQPLADSGDALIRLLGTDGYRPSRSVSGNSPPGLVLHFQGPGREAMAVLIHNPDGTTSTVLTTSAAIEGPR